MGDVAFTRPSARAVLSLSDVECEVRLPGLREYHLSFNPHLLSTYAPDAHGVQVLTSKDRPRAEGQIGQPDPETLAEARDDFGDMLLTTEVIDANPAPCRAGL